MGSAIFSFFDNWEILEFTLRTLIVFAVVFIYFQFSRYKNQFLADKRLSNFLRWCATDRTEFVFLRKIQILFLNWDTFKTLGICSSCFSFLTSILRKKCFKIFGFCSRWILFQFSLIEEI